MLQNRERYKQQTKEGEQHIDFSLGKAPSESHSPDPQVGTLNCVVVAHDQSAADRCILYLSTHVKAHQQIADE